MGKVLTVDVVPQATKRIFGLKTVALAFEYGALLGAVTGAAGGFLLAKTYHDSQLSRVQKAKALSQLAVYSVGGLTLFMGSIHLISKIKLRA